MDKINKETDIHVRTTVKQKQAFEAKLKSNAQYKSGAITLFIDAADKATAEKKVEEACKKLLCNEIMESYHFKVIEG